MYGAVPREIEEAAAQVVDSALCVHRELGPGLLESVYELCLCHELATRGIPFERQVVLPVSYRGLQLDAGLRIDLIVASGLVVELKATEEHHALFEAQLLSYLKLTGHRLGLLINCKIPLIKDGIRRIVR